jgi:hypothetical protein
MRPARVRLAVAKNRWTWWVLGPVAAGIGYLSIKFGDAFLAAFGIWMLLLAALVNWPPRYSGRRSPGGVTIRFGLGRRLLFLAMVVPPFFLWPFIAFHAVGAEALMPWVITGVFFVLFLLVAWGMQTRFILGPSGIERVRLWRGTRFIAWASIVEVSTRTFRGARTIVVEGGHQRLDFPELVDGIGDLATQLLQRAPPEALWRNPRARERLEQLAQS